MRNSLIVLNYNDSKTTTEYLDQVKTYNSIDTIVVVDNNSTDDSFKILKKYENEKIHIIKTPQNGGYGYGNNFGMQYAEINFHPSYFIISNPDVIYEENLIIKLMEYMENNKNITLASAKMKDINNEEPWIIDWTLPSFNDIVRASLARASRVLTQRTIEYNKGFANKDIFIVDAVPGSFFIVDAKTMKEIGYFDEDTFLYCEEIILGMKLKNRNCKCAVVNSLSYTHHHSKTISKNIKKRVSQFKLLQQSRRVYLTKYNKISWLQTLLFDFVTVIGVMEIRISELKKFVKANVSN